MFTNCLSTFTSKVSLTSYIVFLSWLVTFLCNVSYCYCQILECLQSGQPGWSGIKKGGLCVVLLSLRQCAHVKYASTVRIAGNSITKRRPFSQPFECCKGGSCTPLRPGNNRGNLVFECLGLVLQESAKFFSRFTACTSCGGVVADGFAAEICHKSNAANILCSSKLSQQWCGPSRNVHGARLYKYI